MLSPVSVELCDSESPHDDLMVILVIALSLALQADVI